MAVRSTLVWVGLSWVACGLVGCSSPDGSLSLDGPDASLDAGPGSLEDAGEDVSADPDASAEPDAEAPDDASTGSDTGLPDINDPNNASKDSDCDGLSDAEEFAEVYVGGLQTDPGNPDTDGDGILDGVELGRTESVAAHCAFTGDLDPTTQTSPVLADSDDDGLPDGVEDANANGRVDPGETDPLVSDSDGDRLPDGIEAASCTDPLLVDSDGDGIPDGAEDLNRNGVVDDGELNPCDAADGAPSTPAGQACREENQRALSYVRRPELDLQLALPAGFTEASLVPLEVAGATAGLMARDATRQLNVVTFRQAVAGDASVSEMAIRAATLPEGVLEYAQAFTSWDGYPALSVRYASSETSDLNAFTNGLARALVPGSSGALEGAASIAGPHKIEAVYVRRSDNTLVVSWAITPASRYADNAAVMTDLASGTGIAHADSKHDLRCEPFVPRAGKLDLLFVVDDSLELSPAHQDLANTASAMVEQFARAALDWRLAMVTTSYVVGANPNPNRSVVRGFTRNIHQFRAWLTPNSTCSSGYCSAVTVPSGEERPVCSTNQECWVDTKGDGTERPLASARSAINFLASDGGSDATRFREDAEVAVVLLTNARDRSTGTLTEYQQYFAGTGEEEGVSQNPLGRLIPLHGILCPVDGGVCFLGEDHQNPRHLDVILRNGGVHGSIRNASLIASTMAAIVRAVVAWTGYPLSRAPLTASLRVAVEAAQNPAQCTALDDVPRNRLHGVDVAGSQDKLSFFGACSPAQPGTTEAAVSYRSWSVD